jgi:cystathionine gamma-synthase
VAGNDADLFETLKFHQNAGGAVPGPMDCWLALRGIKTLAVRMDRHCANAQRVAEFLQEQDAVEQVFYPGLPGHPGHDIAARQMRGFSGMVSFTVRGGYEAAQAVAGATEVFALAVSLGGVESLIEHPASMTHAAVTGTKGEVAPNLLRLSVGIEGVDDIIGDLQQALVHAAVGAAR